MRYLIFDTETGGFSEEENPLMSLAMIVVNEKLEEISRFYSLVKNEDNKTIDEQALLINKIPVENLEYGLSIPFLWNIWDYMNEDIGVYIAHNVAFDVKFLKGNNFYFPENIQTLDTMHLAWDFWGSFDKEKEEKISAKLEDIYPRIGQTPQNSHNSLYDCEMVLDVLRWFVEKNHVKLPLPSFPVVTNYWENKAFGYRQIFKKGLLPLTN